MIDGEKTSTHSSSGIPVNGGSTRQAGLFLGCSTIILSTVFTIFLHVVASGQRDLFRNPLSDLVFTDHIGWMFGAGVAGVGMSVLGVLLAWTGTGLLRNRLLQVLLGIASVAFLLVAVCPTNRTGIEPLTMSAQIHRYAAGAGFFCIPLAAFLTATELERRGHLPVHRTWLRRTAVAASGLLVLFLASHFAILPLFLQELRGVFQRLLLVGLLMVLAQLLLLSRSLPPARCTAAPAVRSHRSYRLPVRDPQILLPRFPSNAPECVAGPGRVLVVEPGGAASPHIPADRIGGCPDTLSSSVGDQPPCGEGERGAGRPGGFGEVDASGLADVFDAAGDAAVVEVEQAGGAAVGAGGRRATSLRMPQARAKPR